MSKRLTATVRKTIQETQFEPLSVELSETITIPDDADSKAAFEELVENLHEMVMDNLNQIRE